MSNLELHTICSALKLNIIKENDRDDATSYKQTSTKERIDCYLPHSLVPCSATQLKKVGILFVLVIMINYEKHYTNVNQTHDIQSFAVSLGTITVVAGVDDMWTRY